MRKRIPIWLAILVSLSSPLYGQDKTSPHDTGMADGSVHRAGSREDFTYDIELLPGQVFSGYIYHWSEGGMSYGDLREKPQADWLEITPGEFFVGGCDEPYPVKYTFTAPDKTGSYSTTVEDWEYNWSDTKVTMKVTRHPRKNMVDSVILVRSPNEVYYRYKKYKYVGLEVDEDWFDEGYCGTDPYLVNPMRKVSHTVYPESDILGFEPSSYVLYLDDSITVTKSFQYKASEIDSIYEAVSLQWYSYPRFIKWKLVPAEYYCVDWEKIPPLKVSCMDAGAEVINGNIYLAGGRDPYTNAGLDRVEVFDGVHWTVSDHGLNHARSDFAHAFLEGRMIVFGGQDGNGQPTGIVEYTEGDEWLVMNEDMPQRLHGHSGASVGSGYYIFGGKSDTGYVSQVWKFTFLKGWEILTGDLPFSPRAGYRCANVNDTIYILGGAYFREGMDDTVYYSDVFKFDVKSKSFLPGAPLNIARAWFACGITDSTIYAAGGRSATQGTGYTVEFLEPSISTWVLCSKESPIWIEPAAAVVHNNILFLLGGHIESASQPANYRDCFGSSRLAGGQGSGLEEPRPVVSFAPNPFEDQSYITIDLPYDSWISFRLFDLSGRLIYDFNEKELRADVYRFSVLGNYLAEGLYIGELETTKHRVVKKLVKMGD